MWIVFFVFIKRVLNKVVLLRTLSNIKITKMNIINWYIKVLKQYTDFNGRARRAEYWYFVLANFIVSIIIGLIAGTIDVPILGTIYSLATLLPSIAVAVRRMHDVDKSGWYILIPIYNIILAATEGTKGPNQYGEDPKGIDTDINQIGTVLEN